MRQPFTIIFDAMRGLRIFDRFGFDLPRTEKHKNTAKVTIDFRTWHYSHEHSDWLSPEHESTLSSYAPTTELVYLLETRIDISKE